MARFIYSAFADEAGTQLETQIAALQRNGITQIELRGVDGKNISEFTVAEAEGLKEKLTQAGVGVSAIGSWYGKIGVEDDFAPHFAAFQQTVEVARVLGTDKIRTFSFYTQSFVRDEAECIRRVKEMADYAAARGVRCCHENEKGIFGSTPENCLRLKEAVGENLDIIFDFANFLECGVDPWDAYTLLRDYVLYFHVKDYCKEKRRVVPAAQGAGRIAEILRDADARRRDPCILTLEPHLSHVDGMDAYDAETARRLAEGTLFSSAGAAFDAAANALKAVHEDVQPVALGLIGYGNMGTAHFSNYLRGRLKHLRVTAVADVLPERLEKAREALPGVAVFDTAEALLRSGTVNAVLIATPHYFHPPIAMAALNAGIHVLTEKPAGVYTKQVREMNAAAAAHPDLVFAIMYNQRALPQHQKIHELVHSGALGEIRRVVWMICDWYRTQHYYDSGGWRATWGGEGGGVLLNQAPHQLDLWQWFCGMPCKIWARCHTGKWHDIEVEDDVTIYAAYPNGATGVFITTTGDAWGTNRLEIDLDKGKIVLEHGKVKLTRFGGSTREHIMRTQAGFAGMQTETTELEIPDWETKEHAAVLTAFAKAIATGEKSGLFAHGEEGINGLTISNAAYLSAWTGHEIELPLDEEQFYAALQARVAASAGKEDKGSVVATDITF
jgi:predicted dehydrogenase/sugar phosphate isomerase/epimerase